MNEENVDDLSAKGIELAKSGNFEEAIECLAEVVRLKPDDASAYNNWGAALSELAQIRQDEPLYRESFGKYERAVQLNPDNASAFYNWGNALYRLAQIRQDEPLYRESFEKYDKAVDLKPDNASVYNNWGNSLSELAQIRQDEPLYRESFEKYGRAAQLKPDYASAFHNWGSALSGLAQIKQDKSLYREAMEKFIKSGLDILDILVNFDDKKDREHIIQTDILYPLLDLDSDDGRFFNEAIKSERDKMDETEMNKYKKVYILSILIISQLHVNNENEKFVAHYREKTISQKMLFEDSKFWLTAINYSNDPTEGKTLFDYLFEKDKRPTDESLNREYGAFAGCFIFNHDSLNQFRLYGKEDGREGTGLSLVFRDSFFSKEAKMAMKQLKTEDGNIDEKEEKLSLFRCIYIDPKTQRVETVGHKEDYLFYRDRNKGETDKEIEEKNINYRVDIDEIIKNVKEKMEELKELVKDLEPAIVGQLLLNLRYLTKHIAFKEEQECRIVKIYPLNDEKIITNISNNPIQMYIEYKPKVSSHIEKIVFGPKVTGMELFQDILTHKRLTILCKK